MKFLKSCIIILISIYIFGCVEKTTYSGKIIADSDLTNLKIVNKTDLLIKFGEPSYIDNIQNKYFYFTEKSKKKNFYNNKVIYSYLFVFELDQYDNIIQTDSINLLEQDIAKYNKIDTPNNIIDRGLIEKIFGGVGPNQIGNSP